MSIFINYVLPALALGLGVGYLVAIQQEDKRLHSLLKDSYARMTNLSDALIEQSKIENDLRHQIDSLEERTQYELDQERKLHEQKEEAIGKKVAVLTSENAQILDELAAAKKYVADKEIQLSHERNEVQSTLDKLSDERNELKGVIAELSEELNGVKQNYVEMANAANAEIRRLNELLASHKKALEDAIEKNKGLMHLAEGLTRS